MEEQAAAPEGVGDPEPPVVPAAKPADPRFLRWVSAIYLGGLVLLWGVTRLPFSTNWVVTLLRYMPQAVYGLPLLFLFLGSAARRDPKALLLQGAAAGFVLGPLMGLCLPLSAGWAGRGGQPLRVMTYNIHSGLMDPAGILNQVRAARPDVVLFVEAYIWINQHPEVTALYNDVQREMGDQPPFHQNQFFLASRYPIEGAEIAFADEKSVQGMSATLRLPSGPVRLYGVHLGHDTVSGRIRTLLGRVLRRPGMSATGGEQEERNRAVQQLHDRIRAETGPLLVMGDFNAPPEGPVYSSVADRLQNAFQEGGTGWGYTFPALFPVVRIDQILASRDWQVRRCWVGRRPGSHHRPVIADLALSSGVSGE